MIDNKTMLELDDDAAHIKIGGEWRMPSRSEWQELLNNCDLMMSSSDGIAGFKAVGKISGYTDRMIFLPSGGYCSDSSVICDGIYCYYWSSSSCAETNSSIPFYAEVWYSSAYGRTYMSDFERDSGCLIRPVISK